MSTAWPLRPELPAERNVLFAFSLDIDCPMQGCTGSLYEVFLPDLRRRLQCTSHHFD